VQIQDVKYTHFTGKGDIATWIAQALQAAGLPNNDAWVRGFETLCRRESSDRPNAINTSDSNANGPIVQDGHPLNCSRGIAQCIPPTFAAHHVDGTSASIYDPVANIAAAMQYVRAHYHVSSDGSDLAKKVQQANPHLPPHGFRAPGGPGVPDSPVVDGVSGAVDGADSPAISDWRSDQNPELAQHHPGDVSR
jgi:SLT domain-containing protein